MKLQAKNVNVDMILTNVLGALKDKQTSKECNVYFGGSSLPYCQMKHGLFLAHMALEDLPDEVQPMLGQFFLDLGTGIHTLFQAWLGGLDGDVRLWGHWECVPCKQRVKYADGPQFCPCCKKPMIYEELKLKVPDTDFSGRCDGLLHLIKSDRFILLEGKSCSMKAPKIGDVPLGYKLQVSAYWWILKNVPKWKKRIGDKLMDETAFLYIPRVSPFSLSFLSYKPEFVKDFVKMLDLNKGLYDLLETGNVERCEKWCKEDKDARGPYGDCVFRRICFAIKPGLLKSISDSYRKKLKT